MLLTDSVLQLLNEQSLFKECELNEGVSAKTVSVSSTLKPESQNLLIRANLKGHLVQVFLLSDAWHTSRVILK